MVNKEDILSLIEIDDNAKRAFLAMKREDQLLVILGMQSFTRNELAKLSQRQHKTDEHLEDFKKEHKLEKRKRERREEKLIELLDTSPEINTMTADQRKSLTDKVLAVATSNKKETELREIIKEVIRLLFMVATIIGTLIGTGTINP